MPPFLIHKQEKKMSEQEKELKEFLRIRREKLEKLREAGIDPYPQKYDFTHTATEVHDGFSGKSKEELAEEKVVVRVCGRIMAVRIMGKASFCHITDGSQRLQAYIRRDDIGEESYKVFKSCLEVGDFIGIKGYLFRTKTDELSVHAESITVLSKSLRPLPEKWHGLSDVEIRYRQRYLDLVSNVESRRVFEARSKAIAAIRKFYTDRGFLEVETPMMHPMAGGATARPFVTHHNTLDMDLYLRIAPELYLKRLVIGGLERVFEINRNFRNEGMSTQHNPEFTMMESYQAYADYHKVMDVIEELFYEVAMAVNGTPKVTFGKHELDFTPPWPRLSLEEMAKKHSGATDEDCASAESLKAFFEKRGIAIPKGAGRGKMIAELFETYAEEKLIQPTFAIDYPTEVSPLSKVQPDNPEMTERFELFIAGFEVANGFSELNDPDDQRARFENQLAQREAGDDEAHQVDEDYIMALEHGLPPTGGVGVGIDRLVMLLTNSQSIRDVILFPQMRPQA